MGQRREAVCEGESLRVAKGTFFSHWRSFILNIGHIFSSLPPGLQ